MSTSQSQAEQRRSYHVYKQQEEQCRKYGVPIPFNIQSVELNRFLKSVDHATINSAITKLVRSYEVDKNGKRKLMVYGYSNLYGIEEATGIELCVADLPLGQDYVIDPSQFKKGPGGELIVKPEPIFMQVYTQTFSKQVVEKAIAECPRTDKSSIVFLVKDGSNKYGNYTYEEFTELSQEELILRGKLGRNQYPTSILFTKLSGAELLGLETVKRK